MEIKIYICVYVSRSVKNKYLKETTSLTSAAEAAAVSASAWSAIIIYGSHYQDCCHDRR